MRATIQVERIHKGQAEQDLILIEYFDTNPNTLPTLKIGTNWRKCRATGKKEFRSLEEYTVEEFSAYDSPRKPTTFGRSFHLSKQSDGEVYSVFVSDHDDHKTKLAHSRCSCDGHKYTGRCKHTSVLCYLVKVGAIVDPKDRPDSEMAFSDELGF